jgi:hypothetical protein
LFEKMVFDLLFNESRDHVRLNIYIKENSKPKRFRKGLDVNPQSKPCNFNITRATGSETGP